MTLPFTSDARDSYASKRRNWLGRYLDVERSMDREVFAALSDALVAVDDSLGKLVGKETKSAATRRLQLALTHKEIRSHIDDLFGNVGNTIKGYHSKAAVAAADAAIADQKRLLAKVFTKQEAEFYAKSLQTTAARNIETVMTRVLQTKLPLSKRVYKTKALSKGLVDRAINNGLARGDSFTTIARDVRTLINPDVPGGVSYAAKRLARTETNNAFHAQSIHDAQEQPWNNQMRWNLSKVHQPDDGDLCEVYAQQGIFQVEKVPDKPHPHCRCFVTPEPVDDNVFDNAVMSGQYDSFLDDFLGGNPATIPALPQEVTPKPAKVTKSRVKPHKPVVERTNSVPSPNAKGQLVENTSPAGTSANPHMFSELNENNVLRRYGSQLTEQDPAVWSETDEGHAQVRAIKDYTSGNTEAIAYYLRNGKQQPSTPDWTPPKVLDEDIAMLDSAFESKYVTPVQDWTVVSRGSTLADFGLDILQEGAEGVGPEDFAEHKYHGRLKKLGMDEVKALVGKTFTNKGYTSTSLADRPAMTSQARILFRLPPGTRGLYVAGERQHESKLTDWDEELEVILPRNLKYRVISAGPETGDKSRFTNDYLVVVEVVT